MSAEADGVLDAIDEPWCARRRHRPGGGGDLDPPNWIRLVLFLTFFLIFVEGFLKLNMLDIQFSLWFSKFQNQCFL
jgi:hypothetical protein